MTERSGPRETLAIAIEELDNVAARNVGNADIESILATVRLSLEALSESVGECQIEVPYASMQMIRRPDGTREWCCNHKPPHCDPV
jgi:hypothetical protein